MPDNGRIDLQTVTTATAFIPAVPVTIMRLNGVYRMDLVGGGVIEGSPQVGWPGWGHYDPSKGPMFYPHPNRLDPYLGRGILGHRYRRAYPGASESNLRQSYYDLFPGDKPPERFLLAEAKHLTGGTVVVECEPTARFGSEDILFDYCQSLSFGGGAFRLLAMNTQRDRFRSELGQVTVRSIEVVGAEPGVSEIKMTYVMTDRPDGEPVTLEFRLRSSGPVPKKIEVVDGRLRVEIDFADTRERDRYYWLVVQDASGNHRIVGVEDLRGLFVPYMVDGEHGAEP